MSPPEPLRCTASGPGLALRVHVLPRRQPSAVDRAAVSSRPRPRTRAAWLHSRLVSYRLDTSTNPLVSLRERSSSAVKCVRYCRTESECPTSPASVGAPSPTSPPGSGSRRSERRGSLGCPETTSNRGRCRHRSSSKTTHATDGRPHSWSRKTSCTSKPVWLGDRAARRNTERSAPLPCLHGGDQSGVLGMASWQTRHHRSHRLQSLASSKSLGSRGARRTRPKPRPSNTPRSAIQTTVRPPSARRSDSECRFPELLPRDDAPKKTNCRLSRADSSCLEDPTRPDLETETIRRTGQSIARASVQRPLLLGNGKTRTVRVAACYGARRCHHRRGARWSTDFATTRPRSTDVSTWGGCPAPRRTGAESRPEPQVATPTRPSVCRPQRRREPERTRRISLPSRAVRGSVPPSRPLRIRAFGPSPMRISRRGDGLGPQEDPPLSVYSPTRALRQRRSPRRPPRMADTTALAPKHRGGWTNGAARAPKSSHPTLKPAASFADSEAYPDARR
jgi:hypothetical protein